MEGSPPKANVTKNPGEQRPTSVPCPPLPSTSPGNTKGSGIQQPDWKTKSPASGAGMDKTVFKIRHDMKCLREATNMLDTQAGAELEDAANQSWTSGQNLIDMAMGRTGQMKLARNRDLVMIIQTAYSLHKFDLPLYLRLEAGTDSIDHFVVDIELRTNI